MKSKTLLTALCLLALTGCQTNAVSTSTSNQPNSSTSSSTATSSSKNTTSTSSDPEPVFVEVEKKFVITLNAAEGTVVTLLNSQEKYSAGSIVEFTVSVEKANLELDTVTYDGKVLLANNEGVYSFVVLNKDAEIATTVVERGSEDLLVVSDVNPEAVPQDPAALKVALENARTVESEYLSSAEYDSTYDETRSLKAVVGHNDVVVVEGRNLPYASSNLYSYERTERGFFNNRLYEIEEGTTSVTFSKAATLKQVVADETETLLPNQVKESDAKLAASTSGFIDIVLEEFFGNTNSFVPTDNYGWKEITYTVEVSEDNKSYIASASAYYSSYRRFITFEAEFDGDNFLRRVDFDALDYGYNDVEEFDVTEGEGDEAVTTTYHKPVEGAEPTKTQKMDINFTRGYRSKVTGTDLSSYATSNYDVLIDYRVPGEYTTYTVGEDGMIYNSAELKFTYRQAEVKPIFFLPTLIGAKEDGFITFDSYNTPVVSNVGEFTLLFDNGFGEIKEVELTSIRPAAKSMTASLSSSTIYNGESVQVNAEITPAGADQSVTVTLKEGSTAAVELTENEDGIWNVKGITNGTGTLVVTSDANSDLYKEVSFTVADKPNVDAIKTFLTSKTLLGKMSGWGNHFVNFNEDGTGQYVCYEGGQGDMVPFTWTLNESSITLEVSSDGSKSKYYTITGFTNLTESSIDFIFAYNGSDNTVALSQMESKLDLSSADVSGY